MKVSGQQTLGALAHVAWDVGWREVVDCNANSSCLFIVKLGLISSDSMGFWLRSLRVCHPLSRKRHPFSA